MKLTYFGHSTYQLETADATILIDPFISGNPMAEGVVTVSDLSPDAILVTHAHGDHWGDTPEIAQNSGAVVVSNYEITQYLTAHHGYENVQPLNFGGGWDFPWGRVTQTKASHSSSFPDGSYGGNPGGFVIESAGKCVYAAGDTDPFSEMQWIGEDYDLDLAVLPIGDCFTMGPVGSLRAASMLKAARVMPVHYNTFPLIEVSTEEWKEMMRESGYETVVLSPGDSFEI